MLFFFYRLAFVLPAIVAGITLVLSWRAGLLRRPIVPFLVFAVWWVKDRAAGGYKTVKLSQSS